MISVDLLRSAATALAGVRGNAVTTSSIQRRIRVGWVTAGQLTQAMQDARVLGERGPGGHYPVLARGEAAHRLIATAIDDGRITLTVAAAPLDGAS